MGRAPSASSTSPSRWPTCWPSCATRCPPAIPSPACGPCPPARPSPRPGSSARATRARRWRPTSAPRSRSPTSSIARGAPRSPAPTRGPSGPRPTSRRRGRARPCSPSAADTDAEARRLARSRELFLVRLYTGRGASTPRWKKPRRTPTRRHERAILRTPPPPRHRGRARGGARRPPRPRRGVRRG